MGAQRVTLGLLMLLAGCRPAMETERPSAAADVLAAIRAHGESAVIIMLTEPAGAADPANATRVRAEIARMQAEVRAALDTADYRHVQSFASIPAMSGVIRTERGLRILLGHPHVRRIDTDGGGTGSRTSTGDS